VVDGAGTSRSGGEEAGGRGSVTTVGGTVIAFASVPSAATSRPLDPAGIVLAPVAAVAIGLWAIRLGGLWNPRVTAMRGVELSRLTRAASILCLGMLVVGRDATFPSDVGHVAAASVTSGLDPV
jgi:hypothetical protein